MRLNLSETVSQIYLSLLYSAQKNSKNKDICFNHANDCTWVYFVDIKMNHKCSDAAFSNSLQ